MLHIFTRYFWILLLILSACGASEEESARQAAAAQNPGSPVKLDGRTIFRQNCVTCHGADGTLGLNGAKDLTQSALPLGERINTITHGRKLMTPFATILSPEEIQAVAEYTLTLKK